MNLKYPIKDLILVDFTDATKVWFHYVSSPNIPQAVISLITRVSLY